MPCGRGTVRQDGDCDDATAAVHPGAPEVCDGLDDDCDDLVDDADDDLADGVPFFEDADGDGWGSEEIVTACAAGGRAVTAPGDCDDGDPLVHPGADELCNGLDDDCDGEGDDGSPGGSAGCAAETCLAVLEARGEAASGAYWLRLPSGEAVAVWCDMETDGGGWTLGLLANSAGAPTFEGFGGSEENPEDLGTSPAEASASPTPRRGWLDLEAFTWDSLQVAAYQSGAESWRSGAIPRDALRIAFGQDGYLLYGGETGYYWCGGSAAYTDGGVGATDNPDGAPAGCKGHSALGSGWDFSDSAGANAGLTLCGADGSYFMAASWGGRLDLVRHAGRRRGDLGAVARQREGTRGRMKHRRGNPPVTETSPP